MLDGVSTLFSQVLQDPPANVVTGREFNRLLHSLDAAGKAVVAADLAAGRLVIAKPTLEQARGLTGASRGYAHTATTLSPTQRQAVRSGHIKLVDIHLRHPSLSDARIDRLVRRLGPDRLWSAIDRLTSPPSI
jgi:hypothetical protein